LVLYEKRAVPYDFYLPPMSNSNQENELEALRQRLHEREEQLRSAQARTVRSSSELVAFAESAPVPIWMSGPSGDWDYFNQAWLDFRGRTVAEEVGNGWLSGVHPEDHPMVNELVSRAFSERMPFRLQVRLGCADGGFRYVELSGTPRYNSLGPTWDSPDLRPSAPCADAPPSRRNRKPPAWSIP
jgi:PAS domain S-box-containing protein